MRGRESIGIHGRGGRVRDRQPIEKILVGTCSNDARSVFTGEAPAVKRPLVFFRRSHRSGRETDYGMLRGINAAH